MSEKVDYTIDVGSHRTRAIRAFLSFLDQRTDASGFVRPLHEEIQPIDEDNDSTPDTSSEEVSDKSDIDSGPISGTTEDQGQDIARTERVREIVDEGTANGPDSTQVATSEPSIRPIADERDATESFESESEPRQSVSVFGAFQHIARDTVSET
uniref:Uncharacterized protein n=1 Tax=viral metagenome TaxID=1070528 RepID=A0A2V0RC15_9ZZZZ